MAYQATGLENRRKFGAPRICEASLADEHTISGEHGRKLGHD
jgi:hypothetical protein